MKFLSGSLLLVSQRDDLLGRILDAVSDGKVKTRIALHALVPSHGQAESAMAHLLQLITLPDAGANGG